LLASACAVLWAFFIKKNRRAAWTAGYFFLAIAVSGVICNVFKIMVGRARPSEFFSAHLYGFYFWKFSNGFWSMPSGHATVVSAAATAGYLILKRWGWLLLLAVVLVFFGRMMCRAHYLSDVMAGGYLGFLSSYWLYQLKEKSSAEVASALD
jgi:membrane-associated phospholipid phosphatase